MVLYHIIYEYDSTENPKHKYWCGHAALKSSAEYVTGKYKTLTEIHEAMLLNSSYYRNKKVCGSMYCSRLYDIEMAVWSTNYGSYHNTGVRRSVNTKELFLTKVKDAVINNLPPVADSRFDIRFGHFYVIVGYEEVGNLDDTIIYLRDSYKEYPTYSKWDTKTTLKQFWENMDTKQFVFIKKIIFLVSI